MNSVEGRSVRRIHQKVAIRRLSSIFQELDATFNRDQRIEIISRMMGIMLSPGAIYLAQDKMQYRDAVLDKLWYLSAMPEFTDHENLIRCLRIYNNLSSYV